MRLPTPRKRCSRPRREQRFSKRPTLARGLTLRRPTCVLRFTFHGNVTDKGVSVSDARVSLLFTTISRCAKLASPETPSGVTFQRLHRPRTLRRGSLPLHVTPQRLLLPHLAYTLLSPLEKQRFYLTSLQFGLEWRLQNRRSRSRGGTETEASCSGLG